MASNPSELASELGSLISEALNNGIPEDDVVAVLEEAIRQIENGTTNDDDEDQPG
jgi:hypothetical protein